MSTSNSDELAAALRGLGPDEYGPAYRDHVLAVYKMYVEMADRISERREKANSFFLAVNAALVAVGTGTAFGSLGGLRVREGLLSVLLPIAACTLCYLWYRIIRSYRGLNSAKFRVVHAIERALPLRPYDAEWESLGRGKNPKLYLPFTHVEELVPFLFLALHLAIAATGAPWVRLWCVIRNVTG